MCIYQVNAQNAYLLEGSVLDSINNEPLIGASIQILPQNIGTSTDLNGHFQLHIAQGKHTILVSYIGYQSIKRMVKIDSDIKTTFYLTTESKAVESITISAEKRDNNIQANNVGEVKMDSKTIELLPSLMGKPDIINAIRLTPGIQSVGEGNPGLYIRGGDAGQNLFLLDNMPLYNPSHLMGFFPVFNSDIIDQVTVIKGGIPAQYGGKASSVIDIKMKGEYCDQPNIKGSIGVLSSDLSIETPFNKNKGVLLISGRRTYIGLIQALTQPFVLTGNQFIDNSTYNFSDGNIKIKYAISEKTKLFASTFGSIDHYVLTDTIYGITNKMDWSNTCGSFRLNHQFNNRYFTNITVGKTKYYFSIDAKLQLYGFDLYSEINDWFAKADFTYIRKEKFAIKYGANYTRHNLTPNKVEIAANQLDYQNKNQFISDEWSGYFNSEFEFSPQFKWSVGIRPTLFQHIGPYTHYTRNELDQISDSIVYDKNKSIKTYFSLDANLNWVYILDNNTSLKGSISSINQYIHLASVGSVSLPTDIWMPSTSFIPPQRVSQISSGYFKNFKDNMFESSVEVYYKYMQNQIDFKNGVLDNFDNTKFANNVLIGKGHALGTECIVKKRIGKVTGWISYTLSRTLRQFDEINEGKLFSAKYDRIHDLSITGTYKINEKWNISALFIYATGNAMTLPAGRYMIQGNIANHYTEVNSFRMPAYHRLDLSANYQLKKKGRLSSYLNFSIYNVYNRSNPYYIFFKAEGNLEKFELSVKPEQVSLFPILPSLTWTFKF